MENENRKYCLHIRNELYAIQEGAIRICPHCQEYVRVDDFDDITSEDGTITLPCGCIIDEEDDAEQATMYDYFSDVYDITYYIGHDKGIRGVRLMVACGGPNVYVDTYRGMVELYWWTDYESICIDRSVCDEIDMTFEEIYQC